MRWIGYELDIREFKKGLSSTKVKWVSKYIDRRLRDQGLLGRDLKSALGRLVFVAGALGYVPSFLGPLRVVGNVKKWHVRKDAGRCSDLASIYKERN